MTTFSFIKRGGGSAVSGFLNVLGMAVAFAAFYIILVQVNYDLNFNKGVKDSEKIFVMSSSVMSEDGKRQLYYCRPLAELIIEASPNIEYSGIMEIINHNEGENWYNEGKYWVEENGERREIHFKNMSPMSGTAFKALGFEAVSGSLDDIIDHRTLAISETVAKRFNLEVGMSLNFEEHKEVKTIKAIYKDMPKNSHFRDIESIVNVRDIGIDNFDEWGHNYFVKLYDETQEKDMEDNLREVLRKYFVEQYFGGMSPESQGMSREQFDMAVNRKLDMTQCDFIPLEDLYFADNLRTPIEHGNKTTTIILLLVAILVVGIAFINYINFFFALVPERIRAVNTKKVLGSSRTALILSTLKESFWLILMALAVAAILVMLFNMTQLTHLISASTQFSDNVPVLLLTLLIAIVISLVASLYPAFYITSFEPAMVLKGSFAATTAGRRLRYVLIGLQFVISITLIVCSTFISLQRRYMINFDIGIDKEQLLYVHTSEYIGSNAEAVEEQLKTNPQITDVTWAAGNFLAFERMSWGREWKDRLINFQCYPVATDFVEFMGIEMTEGRSFLPQDKNCENGVFIFNESARRQFGMTLHDRIHGHAGQVEIVGFCDDFCFQSLKEEVSPFALYVFGADPWWHPSTIFIRVAANADYAQVMKHIGTVLSQWDAVNSPDEWQISFFDENLNDTYKKEQSLSQLIGLFTLIAIIISLMGVFGLVMFETQYRRKEIALRRVNGASVNEILAMFCSRFVKIVLVCFVLAAPLSWLIVNRYLATFAHRCPMYWWVFVLALLAVLSVTVLVVVLRSWRAATAHPAEALKTE